MDIGRRCCLTKLKSERNNRWDKQKVNVSSGIDLK